MTEFIDNPITPRTDAPTSPTEGVAFSPTHDLAQRYYYVEQNGDAKEEVAFLLQKAGVERDFLNDYDKSVEAIAALEPHIDAMKLPVEAMYHQANELLPAVKAHIINGLSEYGASLGFDRLMLADLFTRRTANVTEVKIEDSFTQGKIYGELTNASAHYELENGNLRISYSGIIKNAENSKITVAERLEKDLGHELMHVSSFAAQDGTLNLISRSGIGALNSVGTSDEQRMWVGRQLLEEGAQEDIRWRHLGGMRPDYDKSVMFWEAAVALDPSLEKDRFAAKFLNQDRGAMIGKIENIFGPHAVEVIESDFKGYERIRDYPDWKDKIVGMVEIYDADPEQREVKTAAARIKARAVLDKVQLEILGPRGLGNSDEEWRAAKQTGIQPPEKYL